jgi:hypothetical protein
MNNFARRKITGQERSLLFVPALAATQRRHLPESITTAAPIVPSKARDWRTVRIRPEVMAVVDALLARSRSRLRNGDQLTISEALAALIIAGLPQVAQQVPFKED